MSLSEQELQFLRSQQIGRLATVGPTGWPHVMPVRYQLDQDGSVQFHADGVKLRNLLGEPRVAFVVDDLQLARGVAIQGTTTLIGHERVRLDPVRNHSWGLAVSHPRQAPREGCPRL